MHIPDGMVSMPVNAAAFTLSGAACAVALARANRTLGERQAPLLGVTAAFVFAAQMLNFPVAAGTSGHFLGAGLATLLLGPASACLVMTVVVALQALVFADGGLTALGTNSLNMAVAGTLCAYAVYRLARALLPRTRTGFLAAAALASWSSVVAAAALCGVELGLSGTFPTVLAVPAMAAVHALIGVGEAVITVATLTVVLAARPDLIHDAAERPIMPSAQEA